MPLPPFYRKLDCIYESGLFQMIMKYLLYNLLRFFFAVQIYEFVVIFYFISREY